MRTDENCEGNEELTTRLLSGVSNRQLCGIGGLTGRVHGGRNGGSIEHSCKDSL